jgi:hypothetical protein
MSNWAILSGIEGNLSAYEAVLADIKRVTPKVTDLFILGDLINASKESDRVVQRVRSPQIGELIPQVCRGWWEEQCLILHGQSYQIEPNPLIERYGAAIAKKLWENIPTATVEWISNLHFAFVELDCLLLHGSSISVLEELTSQTPPLQLLDRVVRANVNRLFCGRSGQAFRYQIKEGSVLSTVVTLEEEQTPRNFRTADRFVIGVGNVGHVPGQATYTLYSPSNDLTKFRSVRYGSGRGFQSI